MIIGRRGQAEETEINQTILYVLFSMVIFLAGLYAVNNYADNVDVQLKCQTKNIEYSLLAARVINSATCLAWEQPVTGQPTAEINYGVDWSLSSGSSAQKHQVRAGIIDTTKLPNGRSRLASCLGTDKFRINTYNSAGQATASIGEQNTDKFLVDTYLVKFFDGNKFSDGRIQIAIKFPESDKCA